VTVNIGSQPATVTVDHANELAENQRLILEMPDDEPGSGGF
jgi:hypothetical protein